jgi:hypothetical protein
MEASPAYIEQRMEVKKRNHKNKKDKQSQDCATKIDIRLFFFQYLDTIISIICQFLIFNINLSNLRISSVILVEIVNKSRAFSSGMHFETF